MEFGYHIVTIRVNETSWAHVWRLHSHYLGTGYDRKEIAPKIPSYNRNLLVAMSPHPHGFDFCMFDFIWEEIKVISESPLKSCLYAAYILHMIERNTTLCGSRMT
jgi:hypothetical protein